MTWKAARIPDENEVCEGDCTFAFQEAARFACAVDLAARPAA
ncbi:hypothetical protein [Streptomyces sp. NPDC001139]